MSRPSEPAPERRQGPDRRKRTVRSLVHGSFDPRRRGQRRGHGSSITDVDWHHPQWLAVALLILLLCIGDALLTLTLLAHGAVEVNPLMAALLDGGGIGFAVVKIGLTAGSTVFLVLLARMRAFRLLPVAAVLYAVLLGYFVLVAYELWLLEKYVVSAT